MGEYCRHSRVEVVSKSTTKFTKPREQSFNQALYLDLHDRIAEYILAVQCDENDKCQIRGYIDPNVKCNEWVPIMLI